MRTFSFAKDQIKILLLENIHACAIEHFRADGYTQIKAFKTSLPPDELAHEIADAHVIGLRSRTQLSADILAQAEKLFAIGCFCIGTNQVDLEAAALRGIPVFNAPFSNTRSVAELVLAEIIMLLRGIPKKNAKAHRGEWLKSASDSFEARGKCLGIIGYGHIGSQLGVLAEQLGMRVLYYDIEKKLALGNATAAASLAELLQQAHVVSLHVPESDSTRDMIGLAELNVMPKGSLLINASRGNVVDINALATMLHAGHLLGAAIDVFPQEPKSNDDRFASPLCGLDNVLLTPHIGGSTLEAQRNIGLEVADKITTFSNNGSTTAATNFPEVTLPAHPDKSRLLHIHKNVPGVMQAINQVFVAHDINVAAQYLQTTNDIGYVVIDVAAEAPVELLEELKAVPGTLKTRILYE